MTFVLSKYKNRFTLRLFIHFNFVVIADAYLWLTIKSTWNIIQLIHITKYQNPSWHFAVMHYTNNCVAFMFLTMKLCIIYQNVSFETSNFVHMDGLCFKINVLVWDLLISYLEKNNNKNITWHIYYNSTRRPSPQCGEETLCMTFYYIIHSSSTLQPLTHTPSGRHITCTVQQNY